MRVLISGTSSGIGKAIAERFLDEGCEVWGIDSAESTLDLEGYHHLTYDIRALDDEVAASIPDPEVLIANAGTLEERDAIEVNLSATIAFLERFLNASALRSVLVIASASARNGAEFPLYVASKAGIVGYMKNLALRLAPRGITCNSISPGGVNTPSNQHILDDPELHAAVLAETLLGKWAEPEEVADLAWFLTMCNRSITGEDILMDNGEMLRSNFIW